MVVAELVTPSTHPHSLLPIETRALLVVAIYLTAVIQPENTLYFAVLWLNDTS